MGSLAESVREQPAMPRFEDGSVNPRELMRRIAEDAVSAIMDAEADQLCSEGANSRNGYRERNPVTCVGDITTRISKLRPGSFFPEDVRALSARRPRGRVGGGRDVRHRHLDAQGAAHRREAGGIQAIEGPRPPSARSNSERPKQKHRAPTAQYHLPCTNPLTFFPLSRCSRQAQPQPHR